MSISLVVNYFQLNIFLTKYGIDYKVLIIFCLIWGMSGSIISLLLSKTIAKRLYGVVILDKNSFQGWQRTLLEKVYFLSKKAGIEKMPEVGVYESEEINAFATGPTKNNSLVALSTGLLEKLDNDQIEAVIGHEISHIANGDMVTMTLLQGVVNSFVLFLSKTLAYLLTNLIKKENDSEFKGYLIYSVVSFILELILIMLGSLLVAYFSRRREYRADKGSAQLLGKNKMISALKALSGETPLSSDNSFRTLKISSQSSFFNPFSSHPSLSNRIKRLNSLKL